MRPPFLEVLFHTSFSEVATPISKSDPHGSMKIAREHSGRPASCPIEIQQPHDAILRIM